MGNNGNGGRAWIDLADKLVNIAAKVAFPAWAVASAYIRRRRHKRREWEKTHNPDRPDTST